MTRLLRHGALAVLFCAAAFGCDQTERNEANLLLAKMEQVDPFAPESERQAAITALGRLELRSTRLSNVKTLCTETHQALLTADVESSRELARAEAAARQGESIAGAEARLEELTQQLVVAREGLPRCEAAIDEIRGEFGGRR